MERQEFRLGGTGGQGLILAGVILAEAAIAQGLNAVQTQSYGPEARGGASKAEVIIAETEIDYPKVTDPDVVLVMSQEAANRYLKGVKAGALVIVDSSLVKQVLPVEGRVVLLELTRLAREELGREVVANIVALGALAAMTGAVSGDRLLEATLARVPKGTEELNRRAVHVGLQAGSREGGQV